MDYILWCLTAHTHMHTHTTFYIYNLLGKLRHFPLTQDNRLISSHFLGPPIIEFASSSGIFARELNLYPNNMFQVSEHFFIFYYVPALFVNHS